MCSGNQAVEEVFKKAVSDAFECLVSEYGFSLTQDSPYPYRYSGEWSS